MSAPENKKSSDNDGELISIKSSVHESRSISCEGSGSDVGTSEKRESIDVHTNKKARLIQLAGISLIGLQFSLDSSVYITSCVLLLESIDPGNSAHNLFVVQATAAGVQTAISFLIGYLAQWCNNIKYLLVVSFIISAGGNFLYSCAGPGALNSVNVVIGGRILCGVGSSSAALAYSYISAVNPDPNQSLTAFKLFRSTSALFMAIGQVISIGLSFCDFTVSNYKIDQTNAPTFVSSFIVATAGIGLILLLENPKPRIEKESDDENGVAQISPWQKIKRAHASGWRTLGIPLMLMAVQFVAAFVMSLMVYFFPVYYSLYIKWGTLGQSVMFIIVLVLSVVLAIILPKLILAVLRRIRNEGGYDNKLTKEKKKIRDLKDQTKVAIVALIISTVASAVMIGAWEGYTKTFDSGHGKPSRMGFAVAFGVGGTLAMTGYNCEVGSLPSIFKGSITPELSTVLMPILLSFTSLGKLIAPIIAEAIYQSPAGGGMGIGFGIILNAIALLLLMLMFV